MVRSNELSFARRGAIAKRRARKQVRPGYLTARFIEVDSADDTLAVVSFNGSQVSVPAGPHNLVPGTLVRVAVDSNNSPTFLVGPATTWPEGLDATAADPGTVTTMKTLAPETLTLEQLQTLQSKVGDVQATLDSFTVNLAPETETTPEPVDPIEEN